jgi:hypothetical protein
MKTLAALLAMVAMCGCAIHHLPRADEDEPKRGSFTVVVCIFASCRDIFTPREKQETPTPSSSVRKNGSVTDLQASRLDPGTRRKGIGPSK